MENTNQDLRQLQNTVEVVGTLKSKDLEVKVAKNSGKRYMSGRIVVASKVDGKLNEQQISVFIMESSKLFKGIETVKNEYNSIEEVGPTQADRVRVTGELGLNEYYNREGKLVQFNDIKGVFFNRLEQGNETPDRAIATVDTVVESFVDVMDSEGLPTGEKSVKAFTVGWGNNVIELKKTIVKENLAEAMQNLYQPGSTGKLSFKLNNYVEIKEEEEVVNPAHGFGSEEVAESTVAKNFVNNIEIIGGQVPYFGSIEYTPEEIEQAHKARELKLQTLSQPAPSTPSVTNGFGDSATTQTTTNTSNSDMPDF